MPKPPTIHIGACAIGSTTNVVIGTVKRTQRARATIGSLSGTNPGEGTKTTRGQGISRVASRSGVGVGGGSAASSWGVNPVDTFRLANQTTTDYETQPARGVLRNTKALGPIASQSGVRADARTRSNVGIDLRQFSMVRAEATLIKNAVPISIGVFQAPRVTLGSRERGVTTARIHPQRWSDYSGLQAGWRLYTKDRISMAVVLQDPQYLANEVMVQVIDPFPEEDLGTENWVLEIPEGTDFNDQQYTPNYFRSSDLLSALMSDFKKFVVEPVQHHTNRMQDFRKWDKIEPAFLGPLAKTMGANIRLDRMDTEARRRAVHEWIPFTHYAGTKHFIDFEGYVLDTVFTIEHLWSKDYRNFIPKDASIQYPTYYPTNHVALRYDGNLYDISSPDDTRYLYELFYQLASVPLVLEYIYSLNHDTSVIWIVAVSHEREYAPVEGNDMPPNFWITAVESDVLWADIEENVMPPNFWMSAVAPDVEFAADHVFYGNIVESDPQLWIRPRAWIGSVSGVGATAGKIYQASVAIGSTSGLEDMNASYDYFYKYFWSTTFRVGSGFTGYYHEVNGITANDAVASVVDGLLRLDPLGEVLPTLVLPLPPLDYTKSYSVLVQNCYTGEGGTVSVGVAQQADGFGQQYDGLASTTSTTPEALVFTLIPTSDTRWLFFRSTTQVGFFGSIRIVENPSNE